MEDALAIQRAHVLCDLHRPAEGAALVAPVLARNPDRVDGWLALTRALLLLDDLDQALDAARRAAALAPDDPVPHGLASTALRKLGRPAAAVDAAERAVDLNPLDPAWHQTLAYALLAVGRRDEDALSAARRAARLAPGSAPLLVTCGTAAAALGRRTEARGYLRDALRLDPLNAAAHHELARLSSVRSATGLAGAATGFAQALRVDPRQEVSRRELDLVLRRFLIRTSYLVLLLAVCSAQLGRAHLGGLARLGCVAAVLLPGAFAYRFVAGLSSDLRRYLLGIATRGRQRVAGVFAGLAVVLLLASAVAPGTWLGWLLGAAVVAALVARVQVETEAAEHLRAQGVRVRPAIGTATLVIMATAFALLGILCAGLLVGTGTLGALAGTVLFAALTFGTVRVIVRRRAAG